MKKKNLASDILYNQQKRTEIINTVLSLNWMGKKGFQNSYYLFLVLDAIRGHAFRF